MQARLVIKPSIWDLWVLSAYHEAYIRGRMKRHSAPSAPKEIQAGDLECWHCR